MKFDRLQSENDDRKEPISTLLIEFPSNQNKIKKKMLLNLKNRSSLITLTVLCFIQFGCNQSIFVAKYSTSFDDQASDVEVTQNDDLVILGRRCNNFDCRISIIRLNHDGELIWAKETSSIYQMIPTDIIETQDGNLLILGYGFNTSDFYLIKLSSEGDLLWFRSYKHENYMYSLTTNKVIEAHDLGFAVVGSYYNEEIESEMALFVKLDINGELLWSYHFGTDDVHDSALDVEEVSPFNFLITGRGENTYTFLTKLSTQTQEVVWHKVYFDLLASSLEIFDDKIFIGGHTISPLPIKAFIIELDLNGNETNAKEYFSSFNLDDCSVLARSVDNIVILGDVQGPLPQKGLFLIEADVSSEEKKLRFFEPDNGFISIINPPALLYDNEVAFLGNSGGDILLYRTWDNLETPCYISPKKIGANTIELEPDIFSPLQSNVAIVDKKTQNLIISPMNVDVEFICKKRICNKKK